MVEGDIDETDRPCHYYTVTLDSPVTFQIPSIISSGKTLVELKRWLLTNCSSEIIPSLRVTASAIDDKPPSSAVAIHIINDTNNQGHPDVSTNRNDDDQAEEEKKHALTYIIPSKKRRMTMVGPDGRIQHNREHLLDTIAQVQRQFFQSVSPRQIFGGLLEGLLDLMSSEYGFIGEVKYENAEGEDESAKRMYLQTHAVTNIAWNQATRKFYEDNAESGLKFYNLNTLFGTVMTTESPVISNNPSTDSRAGGVPEGHPPLNHFLGLPFFHNGKLTGMVGISNKPGGYTKADIEFLEPLTVTCSNLIHAFQQVTRNEYLINTLEESVKTRTQELEDVNRNLEEAYRQVRQNAVMQMQHFACMSHEIRTPLNCIIGMSTLLKDTKLSPMQEESLAMILASGDLLLAIVNDVLDYAKLETDHVELNVTRSDLQDMLQSILYSIEIKAKDRGQSIRVSYDPYLPVFINTDIRRIQQIMFNLLGNAIKFSTDDGVVELEVSYERARVAGNDSPPAPDTATAHPEQEGKITSSETVESEKERNMPPSRCPFHKAKNRTELEKKVVVGTEQKARHIGLVHCQLHSLRFVVTDHGKGIKKSDFESIFRPFQQGSDTEMDSVYGGTGLGLAITKKLVTALGGTISVDSEEGSWSKFTVELPCSDPPAPVKELSQKMSDATVLIAGLLNTEKENVMRIFSAFSVDARLVDSMEHFSSLLSSGGASSVGLKRRVLFLIRGGAFSVPWSTMALEFRQRWHGKLFMFTFGSRPSKNFNSILRHIRSLDQVIPQSLMEMLNEQSKCTLPGVNSTASKVPEAAPIGDVSIQKLRILIAEDNKVNQKVLLRMLRRLGVESVDLVENGRDAVDKEEFTSYDLLFLDQQMPIMGGVQACRLILNRRNRTHSAPMVFFVTAHVSPEFERECQEAGSTGFLPKPFKYAGIEECLRNVAKLLRK